jgi:beta-N-acetylhexosaminidase
MLSGFPDVDSYVCAWRYSDEAQKTAAAALFGEFPIKGRLPISIPGLYPAGTGIKLHPSSADGRFRKNYN